MAIYEDRSPQADPIVLSDPNMGNDRVKAPRRTRGSMRTLLQAAILGGATLSTLTFGGCTTTSGLFRAAGSSGFGDEIVTNFRNRVAAEKAWHCRKASFGAQAENDVFKAGFIDGYVDIAEGGKGCTPLVAPKKYWGWRYQSAAGQNAVGSWFGGYPLGVQSAEEDGLGTFRQLPFCNRPGCGTPACGSTADPLNAPMVTPLGPDGQPMYPMHSDTMGEMTPGATTMQSQMMDDNGPAPTGSGQASPPEMNRANPFNRNVAPTPGSLTDPSGGEATEAIQPPRPRVPADNPFGESSSLDNDSINGGSIHDDAIDSEQFELGGDDAMPFDLGPDLADSSEASTPGYAESIVSTVRSPMDRTPAITEDDSDSGDAQTITVEDIFGLPSQQSEGVEIEFDDLPFSFE